MKTAAFLIAVLVVSGFALGGCSNTVDGMGQDIEKAGKGIQRSF